MAQSDSIQSGTNNPTSAVGQAFGPGNPDWQKLIDDMKKGTMKEQEVAQQKANATLNDPANKQSLEKFQAGKATERQEQIKGFADKKTGAGQNSSTAKNGNQKIETKPEPKPEQSKIQKEIETANAQAQANSDKIQGTTAEERKHFDDLEKKAGGGKPEAAKNASPANNNPVNKNTPTDKPDKQPQEKPAEQPRVTTDEEDAAAHEKVKQDLRDKTKVNEDYWKQKEIDDNPANRKARLQKEQMDKKRGGGTGDQPSTQPKPASGSQQPAGSSPTLQNTPQETNDNAEKKVLRAAGTTANVAGTGAQAAGTGMQAVGKTTQAVGAATEGVGKAVEGVGKGVAAAGKAAAAIPVVGTVLGGLTAGAGTAMQGAGKGVGAAGKAVKATGKSIDNAGKATKDAGGQLKRMGKNAKNLGKKKAMTIPERQKQKAQGQLMGRINPQGGVSPTRLMQQRKNTLNANQRKATMPNMRPGPTLNQPMGGKGRPAPESEEDEDEDEEGEDSEGQRSNLLQQARQAISMEGVIQQNLGIKMQSVQKTPEEEAAADAAKKLAKRAVPQAITFLFNAIASAFDVGTAGIALVVTIFIHLATLGWWNIQMIFGIWILKRKSDIIPPLSWEPIPMPFDKGAIILQAGVIILDLVFMMLFFVIFGILAIILYFIFNPLEVLSTFGSAIF